MKVAGLFAGIGGFELGLSRSGHHAELLCEILPPARAVLEQRFPGVPVEPDVVQLHSLPGDVQVVAGGFPCQDLSQCGRTAGLAGHHSGLIGEVFRLLEGRRRRVPWVLLENVPFMLQLNGGHAMRAITEEFERLRYRWAYRVVDTYAFGLPQRRERVYLVASTEGDPAEVLLADEEPTPRPMTDLSRLAHGFYWTEGLGGLGWAVDAVPTLKNGSTIGIPSPPAILLPNGLIVKPGIRTAERLQGFESDWTINAESVAKSTARWSLVGSAVSVPVPQWIGQRLSEPGKYERGRDRPMAKIGKMPRAARFDGSSRFEVRISTDPRHDSAPHLADLMGADFTLLSARATAGFLARTERAKLRFANGFKEAVRNHLARMTNREEVTEPA
jgi:DNA (cytosine-5)-methyltransferase 1